MNKVILPSGEYLLPESWQEVTFDQLIKLREIKFSDSQGNILATALAISCLMGCKSSEILSLDSEAFIILSESIKWVHTFNVQHEFKKEFEFDGVKYKLVENFNNLSIGEAASIEQYVMEDSEKNIDKILAVLIREENQDGSVSQFDASTLDSRALVLRQKLTIPQVHALSAFFLDGVKKYTEDMQGSSTKRAPQIQIMKA
jgi:hypothetical protein